MGPDQILIDYDPDVSLFAQLESARQEEEEYKNAPAREKTARTLQRIIDNSMVRLTLEEHRINSLANDLAKPETVDKMKQTMSNFLAKPKTLPSIGFGTKTMTLSKVDEASNNNNNSLQQEESGKTTTGAMNFKMAFLYSDSSSIALSSRGSGADEEGNGTKVDSKPAEVPSTTDDDNASATESVSKISSAFTSLTQRVQHSTEHKSASTDNTGSKFSFSSLRNVSSLGKSTTTHSIPEEEEKDDNPSKVSSTSEATKSTSMSSFTKNLKFSQKFNVQKSTDASCKIEEPKKFTPPTPHTDGWKFSKLTKSLSESISELREKGDESKPTDGNGINDTVSTEVTKGKEDGGSFTKFSKSVSGSFSGIRKPAFTSLLQSKPESTGAKSSTVEESSEITKKLVAFGKFLTEDEPRPKTRWQRLEEEEAISFDEHSAGTTAVSTDESIEAHDKQTTLFSGEDPERHESPSKDNNMFADISLSSSDETSEPEKQVATGGQ